MQKNEPHIIIYKQHAARNGNAQLIFRCFFFLGRTKIAVNNWLEQPRESEEKKKVRKIFTLSLVRFRAPSHAEHVKL